MAGTEAGKEGGRRPRNPGCCGTGFPGLRTPEGDEERCVGGVGGGGWERAGIAAGQNPPPPPRQGVVGVGSRRVGGGQRLEWGPGRRGEGGAGLVSNGVL